MGNDERVAVRDLHGGGRPWLVSVAGRDAVRAPRDTTPCHGFGVGYPPPFSGAFAWDGRLWFQLGTDRWDCADIATVHQVEETARRARYRLALRDGSEVDVAVRFPLRIVAPRAVVATYDEMDSWCDDPVKILPYTGGDVAEFVARVLPRWTAGI